MGESTKSLDDLIGKLQIIAEEPLNDSASEKQVYRVNSSKNCCLEKPCY
jgi:hypothetical protein